MEEKENRLKENLKKITSLIEELNYKAFSISVNYYNAHLMCEYDSKLVIQLKAMGFEQTELCEKNGFLTLKKSADDEISVILT